MMIHRITKRETLKTSKSKGIVAKAIRPEYHRLQFHSPSNPVGGEELIPKRSGVLSSQLELTTEGREIWGTEYFRVILLK